MECLQGGRVELTLKNQSFLHTPCKPSAGTQPERVLNVLLTGRMLDPLAAWEELGIYRVSDSVRQLRQMGWNVKTDRKDVLNRFGERCHVASYSLPPEAILWALKGLLKVNPEEGRPA